MKTYRVGVDMVTRYVFNVRAQNAIEAKARLIMLLEGMTKTRDLSPDDAGEQCYVPESISTEEEEPQWVV